MSPYDRSRRTRTLARILGPYLLVISLMLIARRDSLATLLPAFMQDGPLLLATGAFTLMAGLAAIAFHHHWNSLSASAVSLIGLAAALKGAWLMIAPTVGAEIATALT